MMTTKLALTIGISILWLMVLYAGLVAMGGFR